MEASSYFEMFSFVREREWVERNAIKKWEGMKHIAQDNLCI